MKDQTRKILLYSFLFSFFSFIFIFSAQAQPSVLDGSTVKNEGGRSCELSDCDGDNTKSDCKQYCGAYQLNDGMLVVKRVSDIILAVVGSLSLIAFVVGGLMFLMSGGNQNIITKGRATIVGAVIGLFIVFFSYTVIRFITQDVLQDKNKNKSAPEVGL